MSYLFRKSVNSNKSPLFKGERPNPYMNTFMFEKLEPSEKRAITLTVYLVIVTFPLRVELLTICP